MIGYIIGLIIISVVISYFLKKDIVYMLPMCVLASIIIMYIFSICNAMLMGVYAIYIIGAIGAALFVFAAIKYKKAFFKSIPFTPIFVFIAFAVFSLWAHNGRKITLWDEFSHWGRVVKDMYYLNALGTHPDSMVAFQNYPPGTALLQYLFVNIRGSFVEAELYHGINIIYFALMMPLFKDLKSKNLFKIIIIMLITVILPMGFYEKMHQSLYVDGLLGILFAYILFAYFTNKFGKFNFINISLALFVLTITKPSGVGIALLALFVILIDFIFVNRMKTKEYFKNNNILAAIVCFLLPVLFVLTAKFSWSIYLQNSDAVIRFNASKITLEKIVNVFLRFNGTEVQSETLLNFLKTFINLSGSNSIANFNFNIPPLTFIILFMFIGVKLVYSEENYKIKKRIIVTGISLFISAAVYFFMLLCSYLFLFSEYEGSRLASFIRYIGTYFVGVYVFIVGYILHKSKNEEPAKKKLPKYLKVFFIIITITGLYSFISLTVLAPFSNRSTIAIRASYEHIEDIKDIVDKNETVYLIDIGSKGYSYHVGNYIAYPVRLSGLGSIGESKYYEGDVWTRIVTPAEWEEDLYNNYNYVYVQNTAYNFNEKYGYLFGGEENISPQTLYYVDKSDKEVILRKVKN